VIEFMIKTKDLKQAIKEISANRESHPTDPADICVTSDTATFRSVGTQAPISVRNCKRGTMRIPFRVLEKAAAALDTFKSEEIKIVCETGALKLDTWSIKNAGIQTGRAPKREPTVPIDLPIIDTLALPRVIGARRIAEEGLDERVSEAEGIYSRSIAEAARALEPLGFVEREIRAFVDDRILRASGRLNRYFGH